MEEERFDVECADERGSTVYSMTKQEISDMLTGNNANWLFVDGQMVEAASIANIDLDQDNVLRLVPTIGGCEKCSHVFDVETTYADGSTTLDSLKGEEAFNTKTYHIYVDGVYYNNSDLDWHTTEAFAWKKITRIERGFRIFNVRTITENGTVVEEQLDGGDIFESNAYHIYIDGKYYHGLNQDWKWFSADALGWGTITRIDRNIASPIQYRRE